MARALVFVPAQSGMLVGSTPIGPGYPRSHRAHYLLERGTDPVPVWVSARDSYALARFQGDCHAVVDRYRPDLLPRGRSRDGRDDARPGREERGERER